MSFTCRHHGPVAGKLTWQPVGAGHRIRVACDRCGGYIKWAPITAENVERAGPQPCRRREASTAADPALRCEESARRRIEALLCRMDAVFAVEADALRELLDLLVLASSERALRYATMAAVRLCDDFGVPAEYRAALLLEIESWKHADVDPVFGGPPDRAAFARDAAGRPTLTDTPTAAQDATVGPARPSDGGQLPLIGDP